jgi:flagellar biosynthesis protein FlhF
MKIKKYQARDVRSALRLVRMEQGPDAVILSTEPIEGGVEVCAASEDIPTGDLRPMAALAQFATPATGVTVPSARTPVDATGTHKVLAPALPARAAAPAASPPAPRTGDTLGATDQSVMTAELRNLRKLLETQLSALAWNDFTRREPGRARALAELTSVGVTRDVAWSLVQSLSSESLRDPGATPHFTALAQKLVTMPMSEVLVGAVALIGPPGAGKSTLLAKLAVRQVLEHGADSLAILSTDTARLGATEMIRSLSRLLGVEFAAAGTAPDLARAIEARQDVPLILIDTAGPQGRDVNAIMALQKLCSTAPISTLLVLPASAQVEVIEQALSGFRPLASRGVVLTRIDEALRIGGVLAALIRERLPLAAVANGPRIPEDLLPARADELIERALRLCQDHLAELDPEELAQRFGGDVHVAA